MTENAELLTFASLQNLLESKCATFYSTTPTVPAVSLEGSGRPRCTGCWRA